LSLLLLDTNVLLWVIDAPARLPPRTAAVIEDPNNEILFSAASIWEIAIKSGRQRPDFQIDPAEIASDAVAIGFSELPVTSSVAALVARLPRLHNDPFDRLLIAQAMNLPAIFLTSDRFVRGYSELVKPFDPR
jgi:PIN domain nuclease of toxin-antitoxin system